MKVHADVPVDLAILLTDRRCWAGVVDETPRRRLVHLIPDNRKSWHVAIADAVAGDVVTTIDPVTPFGVVVTLRYAEPSIDPDRIDWKPSDDYPPGQFHNPARPQETEE